MSGEELGGADLKARLREIERRISSELHERSYIIRDAIIKAQNRHGGLRPAARALKIDVGYLQRLKSGEASNPSDDVLRKLKLK